MVHTVAVGDSYWLEIVGDIDKVDPAPTWPAGAAWTGTWKVSAEVSTSSPALLSGSLTASPTYGVWELQITPTQTATLAVGNYYLIIQMKNSTTNFVQEIAQDKFNVIAQGITP